MDITFEILHLNAQLKTRGAFGVVIIVWHPSGQTKQK